MLFIIFHGCIYWPYLYSNHVQRKSTKCALIIAPRFCLNLHIDRLDLLNFILLFEKGTKLWHAQRRWTFNTKKKRGFLKCFLSSKLFPSQKGIFNSMYFQPKKVDTNNCGIWSTEFISLNHELCLHCNCKRNLWEIHLLNFWFKKKIV